MSKELFDRTGANEDEFFYNAMASQVFSLFSPFEVDREIDFPKKEELGGVVLKFIGAGAMYFKIQRQMPTPEEVHSLFEIGKFLQESFGDYIHIGVLCTPDIEIRDIDVIEDENIHMDFVSWRKTDAITVLDILTKSLEKGNFSVGHHVLRILVPLMGRKDEAEFESKYCEFCDLYKKSNVDPPVISDLSKVRMCANRWFTNDFVINFCDF